MGVQTPQALAIRAGIGGLSRIWLAVVDVNLARPKQRGDGRSRGCTRARDKRPKEVGTIGAIHTRVFSPSLCSTLVSVSAARSFAAFQVSIDGHGEGANTDRLTISLLTTRTMSVPPHSRCPHVGPVQPSGEKWGSPPATSRAAASQSRCSLSGDGADPQLASCTSHLSSLGQAAAWCRLCPT